MILDKKYNAFLLFTMTAFLGLAAIIIPPLVLSEKYYEAPLFPLVKTGIEKFSIFSMILLILCGMIPGILSPEREWLWGLATVFFLPFLAIAEMIVDPTSHTLWPIEFTLSYGFIALFGAIGAALGRPIKRRKQKSNK